MARKNRSRAAGQAPMIDIGIPTKDREKIAGGLARLLADTYGLYLKTHSFHWNVEGPMFNTLHLMFMDQYTELWNALDAIAERIRSLGYPAPGTGSQFAKLSSVEETEGVPEAMEMVRLLVKGHETVARTAREVFAAADKGSDESTADLLTQRLQIHEKTAWMLRSLLK
jgi:starvation-inducible DNA-binding protein